MKLFEKFKNMPIRYQLLISYATVFLITFTIMIWLVLSLVSRGLEKMIEVELKKTNSQMLNLIKTSAQTSIKNYLKAAAEKNLDIVNYFYQEIQNGNLTESAARKRIESILLSQKIGKTGYIFVWDITDAPQSIVLAVHPKIQFQDVAQYEFVRKGARLKTGYMEYSWRNPDEKNPREKAMYLVYFKPWHWIIAVSSYIEEFKTLVNIDDFK